METTETIKVVFVKMKPTSTGKQRWNVKDSNEQWYSCWDEGVATQLQEAQSKDYQVNVRVKTKDDFKNIQSVTPAGVSPENFEQDILAEFKKDAPVVKPVDNELALMVDERKHAIYCASVYFAGREASADKLVAYADMVLRYLRGETISNTKVVQKAETKEKSDELDPANFLR